MSTFCLFCLEEIQGTPTPNPIGCPCKIQAHESCFHAWFQQKQSIECPICHTVSIPTPFQYENLHIVFVERRGDPEARRRVRNNKKAVAVCCCLLLGWTVGLTILEAVYQIARS
jgi:hypothetical protein